MKTQETFPVISVQLSGQSQSATDLDGVVIPERLSSQAKPWLPLLSQIQRVIGDRLLVTSVNDSFNGERRSGSSHPNGWALDFTMPDRIVNGVNPHFENDIYLMTHFASILQGPLIMAFESDHVHLEVSPRMAGVYRYPTLRPHSYLNDRTNSPRVNRDEQLWRVTPTSIALLPDEMPLVNQRRLTATKLSQSELEKMLSSVRIVGGVRHMRK